MDHLARAYLAVMWPYASSARPDTRPVTHDGRGDPPGMALSAATYRVISWLLDVPESVRAARASPAERYASDL